MDFRKFRKHEPYESEMEKLSRKYVLETRLSLYKRETRKKAHILHFISSCSDAFESEKIFQNLLSFSKMITEKGKRQRE